MKPSIVDPLDIVNAFFKYGINDPPFQSGDYWLKKVCALAERCAAAENKLAALSRTKRKAKKESSRLYRDNAE